MMWIKYRKLFWLFVIAMGVVSCNAEGDSQVEANGYIENTIENSFTAVLKGYENPDLEFSVLKPSGFEYPFYIKDKMLAGKNYRFAEAPESGWSMVVPIDGEWMESIPVVNGKVYWLRYEEPVLCRYLKLRIAYIVGNSVGVEYVLADITSPGFNVNSNIRLQSDYPSICNLEIPAVQEDDYLYREHYVDYAGQHIMNLAIAWDAKLRHSHWVAFSFDKTTAADNVSRTDAWSWDPAFDFATMGGVEEADHKSDGYDKGHLCASEDRVYCKEANEQTFYYTNISPQIASLNQKYWVGLEQLIQKWGRSTSGGTYDKVYVTKGGTLNKLLINFTGTIKGGDGKYPKTDAEGLTIHGLAVPAYYYMAILAEKEGTYQAIGFLVPHSELLPQKPTAGDLQVYAVSIDKLEQETGIDFFCNLPDVIEDQIERDYNLEDWVW